jgi:hypothetical protein
LENDSTDNSKAILSNWGTGRANFNLLNFDGLNNLGVRTVKLEILRNSYIECIRTFKNLREYDLVVMMDMDNVGAWPIDLKEFSKALEFLLADKKRAASFC